MVYTLHPKILVKSLLLSMFLCWAFIGFAQKDIIHFENIGREDGLAQSTITGITQGSEGFMWFGTAEGLHRYDGYDFKIFKHDIRQDNSLSNNHITCIYEDTKGRLWVGTFTGDLNEFDKRTHTFKKYVIRDKNNEANKYQVNCIGEDDAGRMLIGLDGGGMVVANIDKKIWKVYNQSNSLLPNDYVNSFSKEASDLGYWVGTQHGAVLFKDHAFKKFSSLDLFENQFITDMLHKGSKVYITTNGQGLQVWDTELDVVTAIPLPKIRGANLMNFIEEDRNGLFWIGTLGGGLLNYDGNEFTSYKNNTFDGRTLIGDEVTIGFMDREGILWFGCRNGISKFDQNLKLFNLFRNFVYNGKPANNIIYSIYQSKDGIIWLGTLGNGLASFDPKTEELVVYPVLKYKDVETRAVRAIFEDSKGRLWIGSRDEGLFLFDRTKKTFKHFATTADKIKSNTIRSIYEDKNGVLWLGTRWGLVSFYPEEEVFKVSTNKYLNNNAIYQIIGDEEKDELLLVTFKYGLQIYNQRTQQFTIMRHDVDSNSPSANALMCIEKLKKDVYMIGTYGGGINIFDRNKTEFKAITSKDGLPNDVVYGILAENDSIYWLSTNDGLVRYNLNATTFRRFDLKHYLQGLEYNEGAYWKARDGTFYFGGNDGFNYFKPKNIYIQSRPPDVVFTGFKKLDQEVVLEEDINSIKSISLSYNEDLISFEFSGLTYSNSSENTYQYQLEGYDENWINSGKRRTAYYTRLSPGSYVFKVRAANHTGEWSLVPKTILVTVTPPYWQTWWFRSLVGIGMLLLIALIIFLRTRAISQSYKHRMVDLELKALRSQMNPHFIFNSLNSIQYYVLNNEPKAAYKYLTKFSVLMRMILQNSSVSYITLNAENEWLTTYLDLEKLRMENELNYEILIDENLDVQDVLIPSMLIQPYVENSILHGLLPKEKNRNLSIRFNKKGKMLQCIIEDDGIGQEASRIMNSQRTKKHKSQGIKLTGERLNMLTQDMSEKPDFQIVDLFN
ncbi:MAG: ligand-binding sensor domain-containing protein, partial [Bacteroidia bacterium]